MTSNHLILFVPFSSCPQSFPASGSFPMSQLFRSGGQSIGVSASASVLPMNTISFRMDWLDLLAVQRTLKSLLQHHSSKASILRHSAFFPVQLSHPFMTSGKTIALTRWTFVGFGLQQVSKMWASRTQLTSVFSHSVMPDSVAPGTVACQTPLSKGFSRQEYWSGLPFPLSGDLPNSGINPVFPVPPALAGEPLYHRGTWKSQTPGGKNPLSTIHSAWWLQGMAPRATRLTMFLQLRCNHNITQSWVQTATYFKFTMYSALGEILYLYVTLYR